LCVGHRPGQRVLARGQPAPRRSPHGRATGARASTS
jgi:hypothetical protein